MIFIFVSMGAGVVHVTPRCPMVVRLPACMLARLLQLDESRAPDAPHNRVAGRVDTALDHVVADPLGKLIAAPSAPRG